MLRPSSCQDRFDMSPAQLFPMRIRVVAPIPLDPIRATARTTPPTMNGWDRIHERQQLGDVWGIGLCQPGGQRNPLGIGDEVMFAPQLPAISGVRAGRVATQRGLEQGAINQSPGPVKAVGPMQLVEQNFVQTLPDTGPLPAAQARATGLAASPAQFCRKVIPIEAGLQDEDDARQKTPRMEWTAAGKANTPRLGRWQQGLNSSPKLVADETHHGRSPQPVPGSS